MSSTSKCICSWEHLPRIWQHPKLRKLLALFQPSWWHWGYRDVALGIQRCGTVVLCALRSESCFCGGVVECCSNITWHFLLLIRMQPAMGCSRELNRRLVSTTREITARNAQTLQTPMINLFSFHFKCLYISNYISGLGQIAFSVCRSLGIWCLYRYRFWPGRVQ